MKIKILYEDKDILAIEKPSGIAVHGDGRSNEKTITDWMLKNYPKTKNVGEPMLVSEASISKNFSSYALPGVPGGTLGDKNFQKSTLLPRPGVVHRLDRDTSGVLLLAKNQKAHEFLKNQFQNREIKKTYVAIVDGWVKDDHGTINKPIGRSPSDFRRRSAGRGARGEMKDAITQYKVLKRFEISASVSSKFLPLRPQVRSSGQKISKTLLHKFTFLEIKPKTGRTHQIRVHMKYLNHPVVCDALYNPEGSCPLKLGRLALHAKSIEFKNLKGEMVKIESQVPKEILKVVE